MNAVMCKNCSLPTEENHKKICEVCRERYDEENVLMEIEVKSKKHKSQLSSIKKINLISSFISIDGAKEKSAFR